MLMINEAVTVSELNRYIKERLAADENLRYITITGEVSNFTNHIKSGHFYFTLKDDACSIRAIMFKGNASRVRFNVENGMSVTIRGSVQVFERDGVYQLYCETMEPNGIGALYLAFEQLRQKLSDKGLFDEEHKKPLPALPRRIGIVTSKTGAALQDILNILKRRYPLCTAVLIPALVQGENAAASIASAIKNAETAGNIDLLIVGRGGGSIEDLWAFNEELVAQAIYDCSIPIISAVGHEIDFTIADFVADMRAPTPSAAAELCAPDISVLFDRLAAIESSFSYNVRMGAKVRYDRLKLLYSRLCAVSPKAKIEASSLLIEGRIYRLQAAAAQAIGQSEGRFARAVSMLDALSPLKVLTRGYSISYNGDSILTSANEAFEGMTMRTRLSEGEITSIVKEIR